MTTAGPPSGGAMPAAPAQYQPYPAQPAPNPGQPQYAPQDNPGQQPQPQCYPPPADAQADPAAQKPALDPYNIQYKPMEISSWRDMPAAPSEYSRFWDSPDEFLPEKFVANKEAYHKCNDIVWVVLFFINFAATIILMAVAFGMKNKNKDETEPPYNPPYNPPYYPYSQSKVTATGTTGSPGDDVLWWSMGVGFGIALGLNIIHFLVMSFLPFCYVRGSILVAFLVVVGFSVVTIVKIHLAMAIVPVTWLIVISCAYCSVWGYFDLASVVLGFSGRIVCKYPSIWLLFVAHGVVVFVVTIIYVATMFGVIGAGWSPWVYLYVLFSFAWVVMTLSYAVYVTISGLAADWYFLYGTDYFPKFPMLSSLRRAFTTSFGSCCVAGLLLTIIATLKAMTHGRGGIAGLIRCIALCIIRILECFIKFMNKYALIYCAIYGVPYVEGCRRWAELSCSRFVDVICSGLIISNVLSLTEVGLGIAAGMLGAALAYAKEGESPNGILAAIIAFIIGLLFTIALFEVMTEPVGVISDTLLVCFAESPDTLEEKESGVYTSLGTFYGNELQKYLPKEEEPETAPSTQDQVIIINNNNSSNNNSQYMQQPQYQYQYQYPYQYGQQQQWQQPPGSQPQWQQPPGTQPQWQQPPGTQPQWQQPTQQRDADSDEDSSSESHHKHHHHKKDKHKHHHKKDKHKHHHKKHGHKHKGDKKQSSDESSDDDDGVLLPEDVPKETADEQSDSIEDSSDDSEPSTGDDSSA